MEKGAGVALGIAALGGLALYIYSTQSQAAAQNQGTSPPSPGFSLTDFISPFISTPAQDTANATNTTLGTFTMTGAPWQTGDYPQFASLIAGTEQQNGIPTNLLARLLYQESHYRTDIITGAVPSPTGALGIAQFMPATAAQFGIDPSDPYQAIPAAGKYLAQLYGSLGDWSLALMAYNWGIGNVRNWVAGGESGPVPTETQNYVAQITADVPVA